MFKICNSPMHINLNIKPPRATPPIRRSKYRLVDREPIGLFDGMKTSWHVH